MNETREFKGIWMPKEVYLHPELTLTEKLLYCEIDSLDGDEGCFASNAYFAEFLKVSETVVSNGISKLKRLGFIEQVSFDGRRRVLKAGLKKTLRQGLRKVQGRVEENFKDNNIEYYNSLDLENKKINAYFFTKEPQPDKRGELEAYGEFKNVMLTKDELKRLMHKYQFYLMDAIELLSGYIASGGKKYKNHYAVLKEHGWVWNEVHKNPDCGIRHSCQHIPDDTKPGGLRDETIEEYFKRTEGIEV